MKRLEQELRLEATRLDAELDKLRALEVGPGLEDEINESVSKLRLGPVLEAELAASVVLHEAVLNRAGQRKDHVARANELIDQIAADLADMKLVKLVPVIDPAAPAQVVDQELRALGATTIADALGSRVTVVQAVLAELDRATTKFPTWPTDPLHALAVLGEEFGELTQAVLQGTYEPCKLTYTHESKPLKWGPDQVRTEAIQTAAMALRFILSLDRYEYTRCPQHRLDTPAGPEEQAQ